MDSVPNKNSEKRRTFAAIIGAALAVMVLAPPIVQAAAQKVNVVKSVPIAVKNNGATAKGQQLGALEEQIGKRQMVDIIAGGDGFWGVGYCGLENDTVTVPAANPGDPDNVVAGVLIGGNGGAVVTVKAPELPTQNNPVITLMTTASNPVQSVSLPSGLRVSPSQLVFECVAGSAAEGDSFIVLGH